MVNRPILFVPGGGNEITISHHRKMESSYLGKVSPKVLKRLRKLKPKTPTFPASGRIVPLMPQPEFSVPDKDVDSPDWMGCRYADPHKDWDSYFLTVSVSGRREFGEYKDGGSPIYLPIWPGDVFVVDGSVLHWLQGVGNQIPRGWWIGLQWELSPVHGDCSDPANAILEMLEVKRSPSTEVDPRYKSWLKYQGDG